MNDKLFEVMWDSFVDESEKIAMAKVVAKAGGKATSVADDLLKLKSKARAAFEDLGLLGKKQTKQPLEMAYKGDKATKAEIAQRLGEGTRIGKGGQEATTTVSEMATRSSAPMSQTQSAIPIPGWEPPSVTMARTRGAMESSQLARQADARRVAAAQAKLQSAAPPVVQGQFLGEMPAVKGKLLEEIPAVTGKLL